MVLIGREAIYRAFSKLAIASLVVKDITPILKNVLRSQFTALDWLLNQYLGAPKTSWHNSMLDNVLTGRIESCFLIGHSRPLFLYFSLFNTVKVINVQYNFFADDWYRTAADLWNRKRTLYQLSHDHDHCPGPGFINLTFSSEYSFGRNRIHRRSYHRNLRANLLEATKNIFQKLKKSFLSLSFFLSRPINGFRFVIAFFSLWTEKNVK